MSHITWADVQAVYPDIPLDELKGQLGDLTLEGLTFEVITKGCWVEHNNGPGPSWTRLDEPTFWPFEKGGILLVHGGAGSREPFGPGRKSSKWWVESEGFTTLAEAQARSEQVRAAPTEGYGGPSDYDFLFEGK